MKMIEKIAIQKIRTKISVKIKWNKTMRDGIETQDISRKWLKNQK